MGKIPALIIFICFASEAFAGIVPVPVSIEDIAIEALMNNNSEIVPASTRANLFYEENGFPTAEDAVTGNEIFQKEISSHEAVQVSGENR